MPMSGRRLSGVSLAIGLVLIAISVYFFLAAVSYIAPPTQAVVAGLLSAVIGFAMLSAGTSLVRTFLIARAAEGK
jgi:cobalamin biosynthesis protein CobD/CbiB